MFCLFPSNILLFQFLCPHYVWNTCLIKLYYCWKLHSLSLKSRVFILMSINEVFYNCLAHYLCTPTKLEFSFRKIEIKILLWAINVAVYLFKHRGPSLIHCLWELVTYFQVDPHIFQILRLHLLCLDSLLIWGSNRYDLSLNSLLLLNIVSYKRSTVNLKFQSC